MDFQAVIVGLLVAAIIAFIGGGVAVLVRIGRIDERLIAVGMRLERCEDRLDGQEKYLHAQMDGFDKEFQSWRHDFIREKIGPHLDKISVHEIKIDRCEQRLNKINGDTKKP